jgi:hypothetical protein
MVIRSMEIADQSGLNENLSTETDKDEREPSWLLTLRMINEIVTPNIIAMKTTNHSFQKNITNLHSFQT